MIYAIVIIVTLVGGYYSLANRLSNVEKTVEDFNMELIDYKLGLIMDKLDIPNPE